MLVLAWGTRVTVIGGLEIALFMTKTKRNLCIITVLILPPSLAALQPTNCSSVSVSNAMKNLLISIAILALLVFLFSHFGWTETEPEQGQGGGIPTIQGYGTAVQGEGNYLVIYEQTPTPPAKKSNTEIAYEIINLGCWGNGADRKERLTAAGHNYDAIQAIVNDLLA